MIGALLKDSPGDRRESLLEHLEKSLIPRSWQFVCCIATKANTPLTGGCSEGLGAFRFFYKQPWKNIVFQSDRNTEKGGTLG